MSENEDKIYQDLGLIDEDGNMIGGGNEEDVNEPPKKSIFSRIFGFIFDVLTLRFLFKPRKQKEYQEESVYSNGEVKKVTSEEIEKAKGDDESNNEKTDDKEKESRTEHNKEVADEKVESSEKEM